MPPGRLLRSQRDGNPQRRELACLTRRFSAVHAGAIRTADPRAPSAGSGADDRAGAPRAAAPPRARASGGKIRPGPRSSARRDEFRPATVPRQSSSVSHSGCRSAARRRVMTDRRRPVSRSSSPARSDSRHRSRTASSSRACSSHSDSGPPSAAVRGRRSGRRRTGSGRDD